MEYVVKLQLQVMAWAAAVFLVFVIVMIAWTVHRYSQMLERHEQRIQRIISGLPAEWE